MKSCRKKVKCFSVEEIGIYCCLGFCCLVTLGVCLFLVLWVLFVGGFVCLFGEWGFLFVCEGCCWFCCSKSIHVLFIFYNNILETGNWLLIQRASCSFLLSNIDFLVFPSFYFLILFSLQGTSQHSFSLILCQSHQ